MNGGFHIFAGGKVFTTAAPIHRTFFLIDSSGFRTEAQWAIFDKFMEESLSGLKELSDGDPNIKFLVSGIMFNTSTPSLAIHDLDVTEFQWPRSDWRAVSGVGQALALVAGLLMSPSRYELAPTIILCASSQLSGDFDLGLRAVLNTYLGKRAQRLAVAMSEQVDMKLLTAFIGDDWIKPIQPHHASEIRTRIRSEVLVDYYEADPRRLLQEERDFYSGTEKEVPVRWDLRKTAVQQTVEEEVHIPPPLPSPPPPPSPSDPNDSTDVF